MKPPSLPTPYTALLADIRQRIGQAQTRAVLAVNAELIRLYWEIGQILDARQKTEGWGAAVIPKLAPDIRNELPEEKGFSERNIKLMVQFYREYPALFAAVPIGQPVVAQLPVAQIPWAHNVVLMQKVKDTRIRQWYAKAVITHGWSRNVLRVRQG